MTSSKAKNIQNILETEISNLKGFGDLDQHDFTILSFFNNDEQPLDILMDIWPEVHKFCVPYKCTYDDFTKRVGCPSKFGNSVLIIPGLNPNLGAELVAFYIEKTINVSDECQYPEILCCPLKILNSFRRFQMRNYFRKQRHAVVPQNDTISIKKTKKSKTTNKKKKSQKTFRLHSNDTNEPADDSVIVTVSIAKPLEMKTEQLKYVPTKQALKKRRIGLAPRYGTKAYKVWYSKKFPALKPINVDNKNGL